MFADNALHSTQQEARPRWVMPLGYDSISLHALRCGGRSNVDVAQSCCMKMNAKTFGHVLQNRYRIIRIIGDGGMGIVYMAEDTRPPGWYCAIKEMSLVPLSPADRNRTTKAFWQEAQRLANLSHPGLTAVTNFFSEGSNLYLVMEYVYGQTLAGILESAPDGCLPRGQALNIVRQLCDALEYLHTRNPPVIVGDLKPSYVMLTPEGQVKLIGFGIARFFKSAQSQDTAGLGTAGYAAPEQWSPGGQSDARSDIYSLGALLLRLITGYDPVLNPFPLPQPRQVVPGIWPKIEHLVLRATPMDPASRYQSITEFRRDLDTPSHYLQSREETGLLPQWNGVAPAPPSCAIPVPSRPAPVEHSSTRKMGERPGAVPEGPVLLRIDAAVPDQVHLNQAFDLAVAVRQPLSPVLAEDGLPRVSSGDALVSWPEGVPYIRLLVRVSAPDCQIHGEDGFSFRLYPGQGSPAFYFHLTPQKLGEIGIIIRVYQKDDWLGSARVHTFAREQVVGSVQLAVTSHDLRPSTEAMSLRHQLMETRENLLLIQERKSQYVPEEDIPLHATTTLHWRVSLK